VSIIQDNTGIFIFLNYNNIKKKKLLLYQISLFNLIKISKKKNFFELNKINKSGLNFQLKFSNFK